MVSGLGKSNTSNLLSSYTPAQVQVTEGIRRQGVNEDYSDLEKQDFWTVEMSPRIAVDIPSATYKNLAKVLITPYLGKDPTTFLGEGERQRYYYGVEDQTSVLTNGMFLQRYQQGNTVAKDLKTMRNKWLTERDATNTGITLDQKSHFDGVVSGTLQDIFTTRPELTEPIVVDFAKEGYIAPVIKAADGLKTQHIDTVNFFNTPGLNVIAPERADSSIATIKNVSAALDKCMSLPDIPTETKTQLSQLKQYSATPVTFDQVFTDDTIARARAEERFNDGMQDIKTLEKLQRRRENIKVAVKAVSAPLLLGTVGVFGAVPGGIIMAKEAIGGAANALKQIQETKEKSKFKTAWEKEAPIEDIDLSSF